MSGLLPAQLHVGDNVQALLNIKTDHSPTGIIPGGSVGVVTAQLPVSKYGYLVTYVYFPGLTHDIHIPGVKTDENYRKLPKKEAKLESRPPNIAPFPTPKAPTPKAPTPKAPTPQAAAPQGCATFAVIFALGIGLSPIFLHWLTKCV